MSVSISLKKAIINLNETFHKNYKFIFKSLKTVYLEKKFDSNVILLFICYQNFSRLIDIFYKVCKKYNLSRSQEIVQARINF